MTTTLEVLARDNRFDRQLALVREHWASVRRLWISDAGARAARIRSELPDDFLIGVGMPGIADIKPADDGRFEFTEDGKTTVIIPCYDTIPSNLDANAEAHVEHLVDLVAVDVDHPGRFWRRRGEAVVLGAAYLEVADGALEPVPVFKNPRSWLKAGGIGVAVLDWAWARDLLLDLQMVAEDLDLADRLEDALEPDIWVRRAAS